MKFKISKISVCLGCLFGALSAGKVKADDVDFDSAVVGQPQVIYKTFKGTYQKLPFLAATAAEFEEKSDQDLEGVAVK